MSFSIMSKYRNHFMGLAVILILIFHLSVSLTGTMDALKNCCDFGVNIFLLFQALVCAMPGRRIHIPWIF